MRRNIGIALTAVALVVAACGSGGAEPTTPGGDGSLEGTTVTVGGAFVDVEATRFEEAVKAFEDATGVDVVYSGDKSFEQALQVQVQAGNPPDVGLLPQPGAMKGYAAQGSLFPLPDNILASIDANYGPGWKEVGMADDGKAYGVFHRVNLKGLVFYPKAVWEDKGYAVPETWDELRTLMDATAADGTPAWCIGIESGAATGWAFTDWVELLMLRTVGAEGYDRWVAGDMLFTDASVERAFELVTEIWTNRDYAFGGPEYIVQTNFGEAPKAAFDDPPKCLLTNQGNFITTFFPDDVQADLDNQVGVFALPAVDEAIGTPAMVGGDQAVAFADRPEVWAFLEYLSTPEAGETWQRAGGALFPYKTQDVSLYSSELDRAFAQSIVDASFVRFDGGDAMPAVVGSGTFWSEPIKLLTGSQDLATTLANIAASWPAE